MNREEHLIKTFPLEDGTTYIQSMDKSFRYCQSQIEDNGKCETQCEHCKEYYAPLENEPKGAGVGGEVEKGIFIDSSPNTSVEQIDSLTKEQYEWNKLKDAAQRYSDEVRVKHTPIKLDKSSDTMYNWIRKHSGK